MTHAHPATAADQGAAMLPLAASIVLAAVWGLYTVLICVEIFSIPMPAG